MATPFVIVGVVRVVVLEGIGVVTTVDCVIVFIVAVVVRIFVVDNEVAIDCAELADITLDGHERLTGGSHVQLPPFCMQFSELAMSYC